MAKHRIHSIEFKRQVALDFIAGETLHGLAKRHDISRNLIRIWVKKLEAGAFDEDARAADLLQENEAKIAALERMVGRQALEIEFLKGALKSVPRPRSASTSLHRPYGIFVAEGCGATAYVRSPAKRPPSRRGPSSGKHPNIRTSEIPSRLSGRPENRAFSPHRPCRLPLCRSSRE